MKNWPLRRRIAVWAAASAGCVLLVFIVATVVTLYVEQVRSVDAELVRDGRLLRNQPLQDLPAAAARLFAAYRPWLQIAIVNPKGGYIGGSGSLAETAARGAAGPVWQYRLDNWTLWRMHTEAIGADRLVLARSLDMKPDVVDELLFAYVLALPVALLVAGAAAWWLGRTSLRPVAEAADAAGAISADQLSKRVPVPPTGDELASLCRVLNAMLERLERSFHQTRRFSADASHELRTPLTIIRGEIEASLREGGLSPAQEKRMVSLLDETARLDHISESLLMLARFDSGAPVLEMRRVDLSALLEEAREDAELLGAHKSLRFELAVTPGIAVLGDKAHLRRLLLNLLDNAVKFNVEGGRVSCRLTAGASRATLAVGNTGPGVAAERRAFLFERFSRARLAHGREKGSGLGLSLCREIAAGHGGAIALGEDSSAEWTEFRVTLPLL